MPATILGIERGEGILFQEIADAVGAATPTPVFFMAHMHSAPTGAVLYHWENGPLSHRTNVTRARAIWDFSARNLLGYNGSVRQKVTHVPCGYHPTMERFRPSSSPTWDVAWTGATNDRRRRVLDALRARGLTIIDIPYWGTARDALIRRARVVLNMRYYEDGVFPVLRSAHATANHMPCVAEDSPEIPPWATYRADLMSLVERTVALVRASPEERARVAADALTRFRLHPLTVPVMTVPG